MKSSAALSLLFLFPSLHAAALPQNIGSELESTTSTLKRDASGKLVPRFPRSGKILREAVISMTDDPPLGPSSNLKRELSARGPQGPVSNPGEFTGFDLSRANPANHHTSSNSSSSAPAGSGEVTYNVTVDRPPDREVTMVEGIEVKHHGHHNSSRHRIWNSTYQEHHKEGILTEFNSHGEHIVVYNSTHYPNGTSYSPANRTVNGGEILEKVVVAGDEVVVYRQPWNETRHHRHHRHNGTVGPMATATTEVWLPSGTAWIPSGTGLPRHYRKVPGPGDAGFRGPKSRKGGGHFVEMARFWR